MRTGEDERSYGKEKYRMLATNCVPNGDILTSVLHYICLLLSIIYISIYNIDNNTHTIYPSIRVYFLFTWSNNYLVLCTVIRVKTNKPS